MNADLLDGHKYVVASLERTEGFALHGFPTAIQTKVLCTGTVVEVYVFGYQVLVGRDNAREAERRGRTKGRPDPTSRDRSRPHRTAERIRRLLNTNFWDTGGGSVYFDTFTFRDGAVSDVTDLSECNKAWHVFSKRWRRYNASVEGYDVTKFKALAVVEFQKSGRVHYHVVSNRPYTPSQTMEELWGCGFVKLKAVKDVDNIGAYLTAYCKKDLADPRLAGRKAYLTIGRLDRPFALYGGRAQEYLRAIGVEDLTPRYETSYQTDHVGRVVYTQYNIAGLTDKE